MPSVAARQQEHECISIKHGELRQSHAIQHRQPPTLNFNIANLHGKQHTLITNKSVGKHNTADQQSRQCNSHTSQDRLSSHTTLYCHITICGLPGSTIFFILSHKRYDFPKTFSNTKCVFCFPLQLLSETFHIIRLNELDMIRNVQGSSCKLLVIVVRFQWNFNFLNRFWKNAQK